MSYDVFLSHSGKDAQGAGWVKHEAAIVGIDVFCSNTTLNLEGTSPKRFSKRSGFAMQSWSFLRVTVRHHHTSSKRLGLNIKRTGAISQNPVSRKCPYRNDNPPPFRTVCYTLGSAIYLIRIIQEIRECETGRTVSQNGRRPPVKFRASLGYTLAMRAYGNYSFTSHSMITAWVHSAGRYAQSQSDVKFGRVSTTGDQQILRSPWGYHRRTR